MLISNDCLFRISYFDFQFILNFLKKRIRFIFMPRNFDFGNFYPTLFAFTLLILKIIYKLNIPINSMPAFRKNNIITFSDIKIPFLINRDMDISLFNLKTLSSDKLKKNQKNTARKKPLHSVKV